MPPRNSENFQCYKLSANTQFKLFIPINLLLSLLLSSMIFFPINGFIVLYNS